MSDAHARRREDVMGEPSISELAWRIDQIDARCKEGFRDVTSNLASLKYVSIDRYQAEQDGLKDRVARIEQSNVWLSRTIVAILISAIVTSITAVLVARGGL